MTTDSLHEHAYQDKFARFYDVLTGHKDYAAEAAAVSRWVSATAGFRALHILEVGCGTGKHARLMAEGGHQITAIDIAADMIAIARETPSSVRFLAADVATLNEGNFDLALSLFNVVNCILSFDALEDFFREIASRLAPGGKFLFECWNPVAIIAAPPVTVERRFMNGGRCYVRLVTPKADLFHQRLTLTYDISIHDEIGVTGAGASPVDRFTSVHELFLFTPQELHRLLTQAGFYDIAFLTALPDLSAAGASDRMLAVTCRRA